MGTSRVRLFSTGAITMALKPPFSSLYCYPGLSGFEAFPRRHSLHGHGGIGEHHCDCLAFVTFYLGDACFRRRLILAMLPLGDAPPWRRLHLASPHLGDALCWLGPRRWLWPWLVNVRVRDGTGPFRLIEVLRNGTYKLETFEGGMIPLTWNGANLKFISASHIIVHS